MQKPKTEDRARLYVVTSAGNAAGQYVGETGDLVVLNVGESVRGFRWADVEPVTIRGVDET